VQPLPERVLRHSGLEIRDEVRVPAQGELGVHHGLEHGQPPLLQVPDLGLGERLVGKVRQRRPAPEVERLAEGRRGALEIERHAPATLRRELLEPVKVALSRAHVQPVRAGLRLQPPFAAERSTKRRDLVVDHGVRGRRRGLTPELLDEPIARDQLIRAQQQQRQQGALSPGSNRKRAAAVSDDLERATQAELHRCDDRNSAQAATQ
jgi:hypothetical protein